MLDWAKRAADFQQSQLPKQQFIAFGPAKKPTPMVSDEAKFWSGVLLKHFSENGDKMLDKIGKWIKECDKFRKPAEKKGKKKLKRDEVVPSTLPPVGSFPFSAGPLPPMPPMPPMSMGVGMGVGMSGGPPAMHALAHMYECGQENAADTLERLKDELKALLEKVVERRAADEADKGADADADAYAEFLAD